MTKSLASRSVALNVFTTSPPRLMMYKVGERLHTTRWSGLVGRKASELMLSSTPEAGVGGRKLVRQSHDLASQTRTEPSLDPVTSRAPSGA